MACLPSEKPLQQRYDLPASPAEEVWHGQSTARFEFALSVFTGASRSPDIVPIPRKVVRVQSPSRVSRCLPAQNSINSLAIPLLLKMLRSSGCLADALYIVKKCQLSSHFLNVHTLRPGISDRPTRRSEVLL